MTPVDIVYWVMIVFLLAAVILFVFGILLGEAGGGVAAAIVCLYFAALTFVLWAILWTIVWAVEHG